MIELFKNITLNQGFSFKKALFYTSLSVIFEFLGVFLVLGFVFYFLQPFLQNEPIQSEIYIFLTVLSLIYLCLSYFFSSLAYRQNYEKTYSFCARKRMLLAKHLSKLSLGFLDGKNAFKFTQGFMQDFANLEEANSHLLPQSFAAILLIILVFIGFLCFKWQMALSFFALIFIAFLLLIFIKKLGLYLANKHLKAKLKAFLLLDEYILGIKVIKNYNLSGAKFKKLEQSFNELRKQSIFLEVSLMPLVLSLIALIATSLGLMIFVGQNLLMSAELSLFEYLACLIIATKAFVPLVIFSTNYAKLSYLLKSAENIAEIFSLKELKGSFKAPLKNDILIENLSFSYGEKRVLNNINLFIKEKSSLAIVGESGAGKSTLMKLIARFYEPSEGKILIGDENQGFIDCSKIQPSSLLDKFSIVFQDSYLFEGSIRENLALACKDTDEKSMIEALEKASALEFVKDLGGLDFKLSSGGANLSGGQKQRLCIARAILKDAPIILLDEFSSSLDIFNEYFIQQAFSELVKHKTVIIIAHKLKSIINCDKIIYLKDMQIKESGTHKELLNLNGFYARAWRLQEGLE